MKPFRLIFEKNTLKKTDNCGQAIATVVWKRGHHICFL